ncbi:asialoglycoprotein receptor 2-like [Asterias amurensis]|uniref:asialoglycoprotein receptor 2-like n=1 Tax=Asterias amurensis TaxID=7602 RepID=UPI003AB4F6D9
MCPPPETNWIEFGSSCYNFAVSDQKWAEAKAFCQDRGAQLLLIESPEENDFITEEMAKQSKPRVWIGCRYDDTGDRWLCYSDYVKEMTYSIWAQGADPGATNMCTVRYTGEEWYGINCDVAAKSLFTVCETTGIAGGAPLTSAPRSMTCLVMGDNGRPTTN